MAGINPIDFSSNNLLAGYMVATSANISATISSIGTKKTDTSNKINSSNDEKEVEETDKTKEEDKNSVAVNNAQTYYEKQIIANAVELAGDLGLSVSNSTTITALIDNIRNRIAVLQESAGENENIQSILNEYNNRFVYIYEEYLNKQQTLSSQIVSSLNAMSTNAMVSSGLM